MNKKKHPAAEHLRDYAHNAYSGDDDTMAGFIRGKADVIDQQADRIRELQSANAILEGYKVEADRECERLRAEVGRLTNQFSQCRETGQRHFDRLEAAEARLRAVEGLGTSELKPCPFCGGEAALGTVRYSNVTVKEQGWRQEEFHFVSCVVCGASNKGLRGFNAPDTAGTKWNTRADRPTPKKQNIVCHAEGDRCFGCAHYQGKEDVCEFAPRPTNFPEIAQRLVDAND